MKTGIVILNYNDKENTMKMLDQIKDYEAISKIIVIDNASTDDSLEKLKEYENKKIVILENKENKGYAHGNNIGLKYLEKETTCKLAIISNPDIYVEESVIEELKKDMKEHEDISFLGPKILEQGNIIKGWKLPSFFVELLSTINYFSRYAKKYQKYEEEHYQNRLTKVEVIHGSFFMARLKDFKKIKYFDPKTFLYYEENIIGKKAQEEKLNIFVDTSLSVTHELSKSVDKSLNKIKKYKILKKSMFYYEKEYNHLNILKYSLLKIVYWISLIILSITFWIWGESWKKT